MLFYQNLNVGKFHKEREHFKPKNLENIIFVKDYTLIGFRTMIKTQSGVDQVQDFTIIFSSWITLHFIWKH